MLADALGQEFGQIPEGWFISIPQCLWLPLGRVDSWGKPSEVFLLMCLVFILVFLLAGIPAGAVDQGTYMQPLQDGLGFLTAWW